MTTHPLPSTAILRPKVRPPRVRPHLVARAGLFERLNNGLWRRLTLVCAQPGAGKTTLLAAWTGQLAFPTAWLTLDANDNTLERFLVHLAAAIEAAVPGAGQRTLAELSAPRSLDARSLIDQLINDIDQAGQNLVLVLDDYHSIHQPAIHDLLIYLLENLPEGMHLIVAGRSEPPLTLARLRAKDQVTELRNQDLRFSSEEAADFLNRLMGLKLLPAEVAALEQHTEGWITGLQLAALALRAQAHQPADPARLVKLLSGSSRFILDYLAEEVLRRQPEEIQAFLLETSVLEQMNGSLCQAVTGREDSAPLLVKLERAQLFIQPLDEENEWFRYHALFADLLRFQLERTHPGRAAELRRKAAQWLEDSGYNVEAINQYVQIKDYLSAARLAQTEGHQLLASGQAALFIGWFNNLPEAIFSAMPRLHLVYAFGLISTGQFSLVEERLRILETQAGDDLPEIAGDITATRAIVASASGRLPEAIELAYKALASLPADSPLRCSISMGLGTVLHQMGRFEESIQALEEAARLARPNHQYSVVLTALCNKGDIEVRQGKLRQALQTYQEAIDLEKGLPSRNPVVAMALLGTAGLYTEWDELPKAETLMRETIPLADQWGYIEIRVLARIRLARVCLAGGSSEDAGRYWSEAEAIIRQGHLVDDPSGYIQASRLMYLQHAGHMQEALQAAGEPSPTPTPPQPHDLPLVMARAKAWLAGARGDSDLRAVLERLEEVNVSAAASGYTQVLLDCLVARSVAHSLLGETQAAQTFMAQALQIGADCGYARAFLEFGPPAAELIRKMLPHLSEKAYPRRLLTLFEGAPSHAPIEPAPDRPAPDGHCLDEPLSDRELEVLRLVVKGLSNSQIAARLVIAEGTVKRHLHNIYEKMGVSTRPQAIALAQNLRLL